MKRSAAVPGFVIALLLAVAAGCDRQPVTEVSLRASDVKPLPQPPPAANPLRLGMGAMITPKEGYRYYLQMKEYVAGKLGRPVLLVDRGNYESINRLLAEGGVDAAFVCAGPYVDGHNRFKLEILAMPVVHGTTTYRSYIIVPATSPARQLDDLRGKTFAFTDPDSNSGAIVPIYLLHRRHESAESFFRSYTYTYGHDKSIRAVASGLVDGAAVDSLIWEYLARWNPAFTGATRIIYRSPTYGIPPLVVRPGLPAATKERLRQIFLQMHQDREGKAILDGMGIDRFVRGDDRNYDSIRAMKKQLARFGEAD